MYLYDVDGNALELTTVPLDDIPNTTLSTVHRMGVCGASWDNGYYYISSNTHITREDVSWAANIARRNGNVFCNYSVTGATTRSWLTAADGLTKMLNDSACDLYVMTLGSNDTSLGVGYIGSMDDITNYQSYTDYPDTLYGNYGKIIEQILQKAPSAKLLMTMTVDENSSATQIAFCNAKKNICQHYQFPYINFAEDAWYMQARATEQVHNHPTPFYLAGIACAFERLFSKCEKANYDYFKFYNGSSF